MILSKEFNRAEVSHRAKNCPIDGRGEHEESRAPCGASFLARF
jgi:hypothetical protein